MKIGIVGGGQLAMMAAEAAKEMGISTIVLDPNPNCPASFVAEVIQAEYDDKKAMKALLDMTDSVGYEFENIPYQTIKEFEHDYKIPQGSYPLYISQNRLREKKYANECGLKTPKFARVENLEDLKKGIDEIKMPCILKTTSGGYDGKGQYVIRSIEDISDIKIDREFILEEMIDFDLEISVIAVKGKNKVITFPIPRNIHKNGILHISKVPSGISEEIEAKAKKMAVDFMKDFYGIVAIEMFVRGNEIYFNEMAPRPHNSGHYTIEGCNVSQYSEFVKSLLDIDLTDPVIEHNVAMFNILGQDMPNVKEMIKFPCKKAIHMYNKAESRINRKMGHVTLIDCTDKDVEDFNNKFYK